MKSTLTLVLVLFFSLCFGQFRNTTWGMTENQVESVEKLIRPNKIADPSNRSNFTLSQTNTIDNSILKIKYLFENGKLIGGIYEFTPLDMNDDYGFPKLWDATKKSLIRKYGEKYEKKEESLNWILPDLTINAFYINSVPKEFQGISVHYFAIKIKQEDIL
ncbi:hypothetical protein [Sphingobacterium sp.]|uniref:hypothetical protein n=1 Tax=Sphingobacterium sp. TaxID=341027 RepID=UPI00289D6CFA|nr:hypothetical protein [Sphingobacterium sp.]